MADEALAARAVGPKGAPPSLLLRYGSQLGIIGVGLAMWLAFVVAAPRVFTDIDIYRAFAETTPQFGIVALSLTFVVITGEIDLSFPSVMALGTAAFCLLTADAGAPWWVGLIAALATGIACAAPQRPSRREPQHPVSRHHHRHAVSVPRPRARADERHRRAAGRRQLSRRCTRCCACRCSACRCRRCGWSGSSSSSGSCSTGRVSARMCSWSATTRRARG